MRIWRSLDLLLTVAVALGVGVLGILDVASTSVLAGATLATLGVLATGSLATRAQMRSVSTGLAGLAAPSADRLLSVSTSGADADLSAARDIAIAGVTLNRTVRNQMTALQQCVRRGGTVRIAVIDPAGDVTAEAARRSKIIAEAIVIPVARAGDDVQVIGVGAGDRGIGQRAVVGRGGQLRTGVSVSVHLIT